MFAHGTGMARGLHAGTFVWRTSVGVVQGRLSGMTNEGTHREPAFKGCQECGERGVMEGKLCGRLVRAADPKLAGAQVTAAYRFAFEPTEKGGEGELVGTIEGLVVRSVRTDHRVPHLRHGGHRHQPPGPRPGDHRDPRQQRCEPRTDRCGDLGRTDRAAPVAPSTVHLRPPVSQVELTLVHFSTAPKVTAYDATGTPVVTASLSVGQQTPETLVLSGAGIVTVVVDAPSDEVLLTRLCWA